MSVTLRTMQRARQACADVSIIAFAVDALGPHQREFKAICAGLGIAFTDGVAEAVVEAKRAGRMVVAEDGAHWNALGHEVAADVLVPALRELPALRPR